MAPDETERRSIDPIQYGGLLQKVRDLDTKIDKLEVQISELIALANKSKGGLWLGMSILSGMSVIVGYVISMWKH